MPDAAEIPVPPETLPIPDEEEVPVDEVAANLREHLARIRDTRHALMLTDGGCVEAVLLDAAVYDALVEALETADTEIGILRGLLDVERGRVLPLDEALGRIKQRVEARRTARPSGCC